MERRNYLNRLYDHYAPLLTEKQREVFELYHQEDLSLAEIAELARITRQGVYEHLRRAEETLLHMESKLHLLRVQQWREELVARALELLEQTPLPIEALRETLHSLMSEPRTDGERGRTDGV